MPNGKGDLSMNALTDLILRLKRLRDRTPDAGPLTLKEQVDLNSAIELLKTMEES